MDEYLKLLYRAKRLAEEACKIRLRMATRLECVSSSGFRINGEIHAKGQYNNPTMFKAIKNVEDELRLKKIVGSLEDCKARIKNRIERSDNPIMLQSLYLRIVCGYDWEQISAAIGGIYTARGLKRSARKMEQRCTNANCRQYLLKTV